MMRYTLLLFIGALCVVAKRRVDYQRSDLSMNDCEGYTMKFGNAARRIYVDKYCNSARLAYIVEGAGSPLVNGVYEIYGRAGNADRFDMVLENGTTYSLSRLQDSSVGQGWALVRSAQLLYYASSPSDAPPRNGWASVDGSGPAPTVRKLEIPELKLKARRMQVQMRDQAKMSCSLAADSSRTCGQKEENLLEMLHPAVGPELGAALRRRYASAYPVESVTLDGILDENLLSQALTFLDVPLSSWVGPEEAFYCCKQKYRLNFTKWPNTNLYVSGLQQLLSSPTFIGFLESLTGIEGLIPMTVDDEAMLWAGSSLIAISPGGYLHVHNDVSLSYLILCHLILTDITYENKSSIFRTIIIGGLMCFCI